MEEKVTREGRDDSIEILLPCYGSATFNGSGPPCGGSIS